MIRRYLRLSDTGLEHLVYNLVRDSQVQIYKRDQSFIAEISLPYGLIVVAVFQIVLVIHFKIHAMILSFLS
jgi:hypothetical protein